MMQLSLLPQRQQANGQRQGISHRTYLLFLFTTLSAFIVYWRTLLPGVSSWGDSAKFQYLAQVWGIPHPTGYPLYLGLTRIFAALPLGGDIAYRVNLLSALCAAFAVGILAVAARQMIEDYFASGIAALIFAFSPLFWSQAIQAEVYALNALFVAASFACFFHWWRTQQLRSLYAFLLIYGLSFSHHLSMILLAPTFFFLLIRRNPRLLIRPRVILVGALGVALGLIPYSYILVRAAQGATYSEFPPLPDHSLISLLMAFANYISGDEFRGSFFATFTHWDLLSLRLRSSSYLFVDQFGWLGAALGLAGLVVLWRKDRSMAAALALAFALVTIFALGYQIFDFQVYLIPAFSIWALFIGLGLYWIRGVFSRLSQKTRFSAATAQVIFFALCALLPLSLLMSNWHDVDRSHDFSARQWGEAFLQDIEPDALVVLSMPYFYNQKQILLYFKVAEHYAPAMSFISADEVEKWIGHRPIYFAYWSPKIEEKYRLQAVDSSSMTLSQFLKQLPDGVIVAVAAKDEASFRLDEESARSWQEIGAQADLRGCFRCSHAIIGVKGATPGTAMEEAGQKAVVLQLKPGEEIGETGVRSSANVLVRSAGFDYGNVGEIILDNRQVSPQHRGYNIVVIDPETGELMGAVYADTFESPLIDNVRKYRVESVQK